MTDDFWRDVARRLQEAYGDVKPVVARDRVIPADATIDRIVDREVTDTGIEAGLRELLDQEDV